MMMNKSMITKNSKIWLKNLKKKPELREFRLIKHTTANNFEFLQSKGIDPAIPVRKGAIDILKHPRSKEARKQRKFDRWKEEKGYGMRWMVETAYLAFKRYFGEFVQQRSGITWLKRLLLRCGYTTR